MKLIICVLILAVSMSAYLALEVPTVALQAYEKAGQLAPLPAGKATLYRTPWRSNTRTVAAYDALQGIGVYYKHVPATWSLAQNTAVMSQMVAAGVRRLRIAPHYAMYLHPGWTGFSPEEQAELSNQLKACKAVGIRPDIIFVHVPPMGKGHELQKWFTRDWNKGLMPVGEPGSPEEKAYFDLTYKAFSSVLSTARDAGFTAPGSYDVEMGQNLWWGFPALPPFPGLKLEMLRPGGQVYEFECKLMAQARQDGFLEPNLLWSECYHYFDQMSDQEVPPAASGRTISFYSSYAGVTGESYTGSDAWPARDPLMFTEPAPKVILAKPEGFMADFCRHDNLLALILASKTTVAIPSLGVVPEDIPDAKACGFSGWDLKSKGLTRAYAFWLNQGAKFVLLHSAYEAVDGEMSEALIPEINDLNTFSWQQSKPLVTMHAFTQALAGAEPLHTLEALQFNYALAEDTELIPGSGAVGPLKASDAVVLLPFQLSAKKFAVAAYVMTPNIARPMKPTLMTLQVNKAIKSTITTLRPFTQASGKATLLAREKDMTSCSFPVCDDVTWLLFELK